MRWGIWWRSAPIATWLSTGSFSIPSPRSECAAGPNRAGGEDPSSVIPNSGNRRSPANGGEVPLRWGRKEILSFEVNRVARHRIKRSQQGNDSHEKLVTLRTYCHMGGGWPPRPTDDEGNRQSRTASPLVLAVNVNTYDPRHEAHLWRSVA